MAHQFEKHFTLEQANEMIPHVRKLFAEVHALLLPNPQAGASFSDPHHLPGANGHSVGNGSAGGNGSANGSGVHNGTTHPDAPALGQHPPVADPDTPATPPTSTTDYTGWSEEKRHEAAYRLLNALQTQGIVIQDVERGLIDFPSIIEGNEVFLCYELTDGLSIQYYHEITAGYAGRKRIAETDL